ncbi:tRNA 2-selenouridine(34) synthase MnmH [Clostridium polynesiense]|uniref:tRNA 2-selenouridine(34) synthase MnmH n=1 Tax=Clostridium polynesiense TaxID=1325933 RepID=UPI00058EEEC1|nr:tRNA 2-selenouridine(34) synthase MnmH [Clostridium polynesiense]
MYKTVEYHDVLNYTDYILIDVRSPKEYSEATIPGAVNIPLFLDEEREVVGTVYMQESTEKARRLGVEFVSKRLPEIYDSIIKYSKEYDKIIFFCARGGMRSGSIYSLTSSLGVNSYRLKGGYKGYRDFINKELPKINEEIKYIVLHGKTGTGKTKLLYKLKDIGFDILDLEKNANHRGSLLGSVGLGCCNSQKQFESLIYEELRNRKSNWIFVEGESKRIGRTIIPEYIWNSMGEGYHLLLDTSMENRVKIILEDYTKHDSSEEDIIEALNVMRKHISSNNIDLYTEMVRNKRYEEVAESLMLKYYDPMYMNSMKKHIFQGSFYYDNLDEGVEKISRWYKDNILNN